jgi:hypothetical protein
MPSLAEMLAPGISGVFTFFSDAGRLITLAREYPFPSGDWDESAVLGCIELTFVV